MNDIRLKYILDEQVSGNWGSDINNYENNNFICMRIADFDWNGYGLKNNDLTYRHYNSREINTSLLKNHDILVEKSGGTDTAPVGRTTIFKYDYIEQDKALFANFMTVLRIKEKFDARFINYYLRGHYFTQQIWNYIKQTTGLQNLTMKDYLNIMIKHPSLDQQTKIANYLDTKVAAIDKAISNSEEEINKLKEYKMELITQKVFTNDETKVNTTFKWISHKPSSWKIEKLKYYVNFHKGLSITKDNLIDYGVPVISYGQIHAKFNTGTSLSDEMLRYVSDVYLKSNHSCLIKKNDLIFADTSEDITGTGNFALNDRKEKIFAGYHTIVASPVKKINSKYLAYQFLTNVWRNQLRVLCNGTRSFSITQKILCESYVAIPSLQEQEEIVDYLDKKCKVINKLIEIKNNKIETLKEYKKSLIYECVTGRRDIPCQMN